MGRSEKPEHVHGTPHSEGADVEVALREVVKVCPPAGDLLSLYAFLASAEIPPELVARGARHLPRSAAALGQDPKALNEAIAALKSHALVASSNGGGPAVAPEVQAALREKLSDRAEKNWAETAVRVVNSAFPNHHADGRNNPMRRRLLPHAIAAVGHAESLGVAPRETGRLLNQIGIYLAASGQFEEARQVLARALAIGRAAEGDGHPHTGIRYNNLAVVLGRLGHLDKAEACAERAHRILRDALGEDHPHAVTCWINLETLKERTQKKGR